MAENNMQNGFVSGNQSGQASASETDKLKDGLVHGAGDIAREVKQVAGDVVGQAKKAAGDKIGTGKDFAAEHLGSVAEALRTTGEQLKTKENVVTEYVTMAAAQVDKVSQYLQTRTLSQLMGDVEGFARREPAMFMGGALVLGIVGGRFLKSATPKRAEMPGVTGGYQGASPHPALPAASGTYGTSSQQHGSSWRPNQNRFGSQGSTDDARPQPAEGTSYPNPSQASPSHGTSAYGSDRTAGLGGMSGMGQRSAMGIGAGTSPSGQTGQTAKPGAEPTIKSTNEQSGIKSTVDQSTKPSNTPYDASNRADTTPNAMAPKPGDASRSGAGTSGNRSITGENKRVDADKPRNGSAGAR